MCISMINDAAGLVRGPRMRGWRRLRIYTPYITVNQGLCECLFATRGEWLNESCLSLQLGVAKNFPFRCCQPSPVSTHCQTCPSIENMTPDVRRTVGYV